MNQNHDVMAIYDLCKEHMHAYVMAELRDLTRFDGIVTGLDDEYVYFAVPVEHDPHAYAARRNGNMPELRRFNRVIVPITGLTNLNRLSWY